MVATSQLGGRRLRLWGLGLASWAGARLDVEVLQDVVVDLGGDLLLLQHLLDGLVSGAGSDRGTPLHGASWLLQFHKEQKHNRQKNLGSILDF